MTKGPTLSVIVPVYNMERYIGPCLSTILGFRHVPMEVIVVEDGSTDGTNAVLAAFADPRLKILRERHGGVSAARNAGFRAARGQLILPFDADDVPLVENWPSLLATLAADPDAVLVYGASRPFWDDADDFPRTPPSTGVYPENEAAVPLIFKESFVPIGAAVVRREAIETAGLWNETLTVGEDWEMWCRLSCVGRFIYCPVLAMGNRVHSRSATGAPVSRSSCDPGLAAIEVIYSHPEVRRKTGARHHKLKREAIAWQTYLWGARLVRSGAYWSGAKAFARMIVHDPSRLLFLCSYPRRRLRQLMDQRQV